MLTTHKAALAVAASTALLCLPTLSIAAWVPADEVATQAQPASHYLAQAVAQATAEQALGTRTLYDQTPWFDLTSAEMSEPTTLKLRAHSDLALWNLVATVHAQQKNKLFDLADTSKQAVWELERDHVSAVPLPGVVWLFVMGVLGLAGTRVRGVKGESHRRADALPLGPLAAA